MTTINDIHDLVDLLQNHPDWAETLRNIILTRELLGLPQTFARALQDWAETNQSLLRVETSQRLLHGRLGQLAGRHYEEEADRVIRRLLAREMDILEPATLQRGWTAPDPGYATILPDICTEALNSGAIDAAEDEELSGADLVVLGRKNDNPIYAVIEVSITAGIHDFERADRNAAVLRRALPPENTTTVESAVIADSLASEVDRTSYRATYINLPYRREEYQAAIDAVDAPITAAASAETSTNS